ncbi:hypothetical protein [Flavobacterium sp.]|jgi:hypothetical protein|uniref:hypothetical protein n=1 Tax=Flavobacterium sp. TaxID=239 RepID=UPI0037BF23E9
MTREEILPIARKHGFAGCEVGIRMVGLVNEILSMQSGNVGIDELYEAVLVDGASGAEDE